MPRYQRHVVKRIDDWAFEMTHHLHIVSFHNVAAGKQRDFPIDNDIFRVKRAEQRPVEIYDLHIDIRYLFRGGELNSTGGVGRRRDNLVVIEELLELTISSPFHERHNLHAQPIMNRSRTNLFHIPPVINDLHYNLLFPALSSATRELAEGTCDERSIIAMSPEVRCKVDI
jgi:hypothetical protein